MYPIAERHNVKPKSTDFVLTHQQHPSMTTRPDDLTITLYRLDAILERKFRIKVHGAIIDVVVEVKFEILTCTVLFYTLEICRIIAPNLTGTTMAVLTGPSPHPLWTTTRWKYGLQFLVDITRCFGSRCRSHIVLATKLHDAIHV
jgi:hypothetical protein